MYVFQNVSLVKLLCGETIGCDHLELFCLKRVYFFKVQGLMMLPKE